MKRYITNLLILSALILGAIGSTPIQASTRLESEVTEGMSESLIEYVDSFRYSHEEPITQDDLDNVGVVNTTYYVEDDDYTFERKRITDLSGIEKLKNVGRVNLVVGSDGYFNISNISSIKNLTNMEAIQLSVENPYEKVDYDEGLKWYDALLNDQERSRIVTSTMMALFLEIDWVPTEWIETIRIEMGSGLTFYDYSFLLELNNFESPFQLVIMGSEAPKVYRAIGEEVIKDNEKYFMYSVQNPNIFVYQDGNGIVQADDNHNETLSGIYSKLYLEGMDEPDTIYAEYESLEGEIIQIEDIFEEFKFKTVRFYLSEVQYNYLLEQYENEGVETFYYEDYANSQLRFLTMSSYLSVPGSQINQFDRIDFYFDMPRAEKYTVDFESNGGTPVDSITNVVANSRITEPTPPTKANHIFKGWYKESTLNNLWNFSSDQVVSNMTLYAKWEVIGVPVPKYIVDFESNGGTPVDSITNVVANSTISEPTAPTKLNHTFKGWYKESTLDNAWDFNTDQVVSNMTLYAKWEVIVVPVPKYIVDFESNGGTPVDSIINVVANSTISEPTPPTKLNHTFKGWYKESTLENLWNFSSDEVVSNMTLYAKWEVKLIPEVPEVSVTPKPSIDLEPVIDKLLPYTGVVSSDQGYLYGFGIIILGIFVFRRKKNVC